MFDDSISETGMFCAAYTHARIDLLDYPHPITTQLFIISAWDFSVNINVIQHQPASQKSGASSLFSNWHPCMDQEDSWKIVLFLVAGSKTNSRQILNST